LPVNNASVLEPTIVFGGQPGDVEIVPGDGTAPIPVTSGVEVAHAYGSPFSGDVVIRFRRGTLITELSDTSTPWVFNLAALPDSLTVLSITAPASATAGDHAELPAGLTYYRNAGSNTTSGDIGDNKLPAGLTYYRNQGSNTTVYSAGGGLNSINRQFTSLQNPGHTTAEVDRILADLVAANQTPTSDRTVNVAGLNQPPTSNADVLILQGRGWTVTTN